MVTGAWRLSDQQILILLLTRGQHPGYARYSLAELNTSLAADIQSVQKWSELPEMARLDARRFGRLMNRQFPALRNNPKLTSELCKMVYDQLCAKKPVGRPPRPEITKAEMLLKRYRREHPCSDSELWGRIAPEVLPGWADLTHQQKTAAKRKLMNQVAARRSARRKWRRLRKQRGKSV